MDLWIFGVSGWLMVVVVVVTCETLRRTEESEEMVSCTNPTGPLIERGLACG